MFHNVWWITFAAVSIAKESLSFQMLSRGDKQLEQRKSLLLSHKTRTDEISSTKHRLHRLDLISRLPPPGGTDVDENRLLLKWKCYFDSIKLLKESSAKSLSLRAKLTGDYDESIVGRNHSSYSSLVTKSLSYHNDYGSREVSAIEKDIRYKIDSALKDLANVKDSREMLRIHQRCRKAIQVHGKHGVTTIHPEIPLKLVREVKSLPLSKWMMSSTWVQRGKRSVSQESMRYAVRFTIDSSYPDVAKGRLQEFDHHILRQIAMSIRIPLSSFEDFKIQPGMDVIFTLVVRNDDSNFLMDDRTIINAADDLKSQLRAQTLPLTDLEGKPLIPMTSIESLTNNTPTAITYAILGILSSILILMILFLIMVCIVSKNKTKTTYTEILPTKTVYRNMAIQESGRESMDSIGRYSYDSGLWLGPGPEPNFNAPEAYLYRPPTSEEMASTPRPTTAVRTRLKRHWNIDPQQTLPPIPDDAETSRDNIRMKNQYNNTETIF